MVPEASRNGIAQVSEFSLVLGGPLFQLWRRTHLSGPMLELLSRRLLAAALVAWVPLLVLSAVGGRAVGNAVMVPFLSDIEAHARFLVALPLLLVAEVVVHRRIGPVVAQLVQRRIVRDEDLPKVADAVRSTSRAVHSAWPEVGLLVLVYTGGLWIWRNQVALEGATWYATPGEAGFRLTSAGFWYHFVSVPLFQFTLARWYMRFGFWVRLLWKISRLNLHLTATHPDRSGGIGFLGHASGAFGTILCAQGALLSGLIANRVLYRGQPLLSFKMEAVGWIAGFVLLTVAPLFSFAAQLERAHRKGRAEYDQLGSSYVFAFEEKWIRRGGLTKAEILGTADIQSLADLANSCAVVYEMRYVPFSMADVTWLAAIAAAPLIPLGLTMFSLEDMLTGLVQVLL